MRERERRKNVEMAFFHWSIISAENSPMKFRANSLEQKRERKTEEKKISVCVCVAFFPFLFLFPEL